ncbi:hypothetical protein [Streptomyces sp. B21-083]|uniref:hypothetical protein n=1 Tax=Streptomyces sp. B21-083 TaxID=3039410 RepID=UPI002FF35B6D
MRTTPSPAAASGRALGRLVKALVSLLALAAAVAGLPILLAWVTPVIWSASSDDLAHLLDRQDTGGAFLLLLLAVGWIGWAQFAFCAVRELIAQLRGRTWHVPRGMGSSQRAAALLIGSILVLLPTSSALASDAQAAPATSAASIPGQAQPSQSAETQPAPTSTSAMSTTGSRASYTVRETRPAESLWGIAERELGDGEQWQEIASLNEGRVMPDGQVFRANSFLQPGWQLQMPESGIPDGGVHTQLAESTPAASEKGQHVVRVHSGDYLSKIAEKELGDGNEWPKLFEASKGKPQPHGLPEITDPDMIFTGQQVTMPGSQTDRPTSPQDSHGGDKAGGQETDPPASQTPGGEQTPDNSSGDAQPPGQSIAPGPLPSAPSTPSSRPAEQPPDSPAAPQHNSASASAASPSAPASATADGPLSLKTVAGAGALLAAAITGALAVRRMLQRRRRKPGEKIAIAAETSPAEAQLATAADPGAATRLDVALRTMAHQAVQQENAPVLPGIRAAQIGARTLEVLPEDLAQEPQAPFVAGKAGWWVLAADAALLDEEAARDVTAPYPGLVTVGSTDGGDLLLLNLARVPALLLDGNPLHITEVCTSLALELGMSPWAGEVEVVAVGFGEDLPHLLPTARIAHMRQARHALRDLSQRLLEAHQLPETRHQPYLLLCASSLDPDIAWEFADVIDKAGVVPVTLIAPASTAAAHFPEAEILNASVSDPQHLDSAGTDITVQRLDHASYLQITTALMVSSQPAHPADGPWENVPDEPGRVQHPEPEESAAPAAGTDTMSSPAADTGGKAFPALLAAAIDLSDLRLLPATVPSFQAAQNPGPVTDAPPAPASQGREDEHAAGEPAVEDGPEPEADADGTHDLHAPEIRVLGRVQVDGVDNTGHGPRMAQLAALLFFRAGRSADALCFDMDPTSPWSTSTLNARLQGLRRSLGSDPAGNPYVPRRSSGEDPYRLSPGVRCDWTRFLRLVERALPHGPAGLPDLEKALTLVRGKPFGGKPLAWAEPLRQEMVTRTIDVTHTVATYRTPAGAHHDLSAARRAVATGLDVDDTAELLYRDWMRIEHAAGNRQGLHTAITRVQHINRSLDCSLETTTEHLINQLLGSAPPPPGENT